jgi:predicted Abi (CAAX) family protease
MAVTTMWATTLVQRAILALTTVPIDAQCWWQVGKITIATTAAAGVGATISGFIDPVRDLDLSPIQKHWWKPFSALFFPSLVEEVLWRGLWIPHPSLMAVQTTPYWRWALHSATLTRRAGIVLVFHVVSHPIAGWTVWPRGKDVFNDPRFLFLATIVLGGSTLSYLVSGGSAWAAAITHGIPVALWRDFYGGEAKLMAVLGDAKAAENSNKTE